LKLKIGLRLLSERVTVYRELKRAIEEFEETSEGGHQEHMT